MALQLYLDLNSQPCRSVYIFAKKNNIAFEFKQVSLAEGQQYSEEFEKVNLLKRVPALKDGDFTMAESVAILKYLAGKYKTPDHWYPANLQQRARVDEYLAWQHTTIRFHGSRLYMFKSCPQLKLEPLWDRLRAPYVWPHVTSTSASMPFWIIMVMMGLLPLLSGQPIPTDKMNEAVSDLQTSIRLFEDKFLQDRPFIAGREVSLADLVAIVELMQPLGVGFDPFRDRPKLCSWRDRVEAAVGKELLDEAHEKMMKRSGSLSNLDVNSPAMQRFVIGLKKTYMTWRQSPVGCKSTC